jgi:hypothetical protein
MARESKLGQSLRYNHRFAIWFFDNPTRACRADPPRARMLPAILQSACRSESTPSGRPVRGAIARRIFTRFFLRANIHAKYAAARV